MPVTCDRHPTQSAWWKCPRCYKSLCPQCISKRTGGQLNEMTYYFCLRCNVEAKALELSNVITPMWGRLHKFFTYPISSLQSSGLIIVLAIISALLSRPGFLSLMIHFLLWAVMVKYAFEALKATSSGHLQPPPLNAKVLVEDYGIVFKQIALFLVLLIVFTVFVAPAGPAMMAVSLIVGAIILPAMLILMIINGSLGKALNPVLVIGLITRIGLPYFLLLFFLMLLTGAPTALGYTFIRHLPEPIRLFMIAAANNYYTLIMYNMMGYIILQYHNRLNYHVELETVLASMYPSGFANDTNAEQAQVVAQHDSLINEVSQLVQEGQLDEAIAQIEQQVETGSIQNLTLSNQYIGLLQMRQQQEPLLAYAPHHLELLIKAEEKQKTLELYAACLRIKKTFSPRPLVLFKIAGWLNDNAKNKEAIFALNCLIKAYPQDALVPKALYRAAQIFHERLMDAEKAKKILHGLIRKFPDHDMAAFAKNYLSSL